MCLFRRMEKEVHPSLGGHLREAENAIYQKAKKEFLNRLDNSLEGKKRVENIFALVDELTLEFLKDNPITCHYGCAWCCYQLVSCTTLEMELIVDYLKFLPRKPRRVIIQRVKKETLRLRKLHRKIEASSPPGLPKRWELLAEPLEKAHYGRPCSFLNSAQSCSIYPVRTIDCRTAKTNDNVCGKTLEETQAEGVEAIRLLEEGPKPIRLFFDQVASDLIMEEEEKIYGAIQVVPLAAWSFVPQFEEFFF